MSNTHPDSSDQDRISGIFIPLRAPDDGSGMHFSDWCAYLATRKLIILSTTVVAAILSIALAFLSTPIYRAEVLLAPNSEQPGSSLLTGIAGQFDTLSSFAGLSVSDDSMTEEAIATLTSRDFTVSFVHSENLMPILFADKWDSSSEKWVAQDLGDVPSDWDAFELFDSEIRAISRQVGGLFVVSIEWRDRELVAKWANQLIANLNELMRRRAIDEATANIEFLRQELQETSIVELRTAIARLIEAQVKTAMLARVRDQYSFKVIDPAVAPDVDEYVRPNRVLIIIIGILFGFLAAITFALVTKRTARDSE